MTVITTKPIRDQLHDLRGQRRQLEDAAAAARTEFAEAPNTQNSRRLAEAVNAVEAITSQIRDLEESERGVLGAIQGRSNGATGTGDLAEQLRDPELVKALHQVAHSSGRVPNLTLAHIDRSIAMGWTGGMLAAAGVVTGTPGMTQAPMDRLVPAPTAVPSFLSLLQSEPMDGPSVPYTAEVAVEGGPAPVAPGTVKPAVGINFEDRVATSTTIAGWTKVNRQTLDDVDRLQAFLRTRMLELLRQEVQEQVLTGDGVVSDITGQEGLRGLLNTSGLAQVEGTGVEAILDGIVAIAAVGGTPNFLALNLADWAELLKTKGDDGAYLANPFTLSVGRPPAVYGLTMTPDVGIPPDTWIVGDSRGASLLWREGVTIRAGEEQDDMTRNRLTILAECRVALAVWIPAFMCVIAPPAAPLGTGGAAKGAPAKK